MGKKPGPKPKPVKFKRTERLEIVLTPDERRVINGAAKQHGMQLAVYVRASALAAASLAKGGP